MHHHPAARRAALFHATLLLATALVVAAGPLEAQRPDISTAVRRQFVAVDTAVVALENLRVIDGTGAPARDGQTLLVRDGRIVEMGDAATIRSENSMYARLFPHAAALEVAFVRAGGLLVAGTDPTGGGGVIPGYSNQRALELLVEAGFTPLEAIRITTLNGAISLGRDDLVGSLAVGKQADLVILDGDPSTTISDIRNVHMVFRQGVGYDPARLIESVAGQVGFF